MAILMDIQPNMNYPLVIWHIAIENGHRNSEFTHLKMVIFHSYVSLPEGIHSYIPRWYPNDILPNQAFYMDILALVHGPNHGPFSMSPWSTSPVLRAGLAKGLNLPAELAAASREVVVEVLAAELGATGDRANFVARGETAGRDSRF